MMPRLTGFAVRCGGDPSRPGAWSGALGRPCCGRRLLVVRDHSGRCGYCSCVWGGKLLWEQRLRRDLAPIYRLVACRRGHRDALLVSNELAGSSLGDDHPELAVCEVCGRAVEWPNGRPALVHREQE